jgi:hypothetical protein
MPEADKGREKFWLGQSAKQQKARWLVAPPYLAKATSWNKAKLKEGAAPPSQISLHINRYAEVINDNPLSMDMLQFQNNYASKVLC